MTMRIINFREGKEKLQREKKSHSSDLFAISHDINLTFKDFRTCFSLCSPHHIHYPRKKNRQSRKCKAKKTSSRTTAVNLCKVMNMHGNDGNEQETKKN